MKKRNGFVSNSSSSSFICEVSPKDVNVDKTLTAILDFYNELFETNKHFDEVFGDVFVVGKDKRSESYLETITYFLKDQYYGKKDLKGKLIINSASDNSIPYELFDVIERKFKGIRIHMG